MTNDTLRALYVLAADYHSGQWSRGYRFGCKVGDVMKHRKMEYPLNWEITRASAEYAKYQAMAERYF